MALGPGLAGLLLLVPLSGVSEGDAAAAPPAEAAEDPYSVFDPEEFATLLGLEVVITRQDGRRLRGVLLDVTADALRMRWAENVISLPASEVRQVVRYVKPAPRVVEPPEARSPERMRVSRPASKSAVAEARRRAAEAERLADDASGEAVGWMVASAAGIGGGSLLAALGLFTPPPVGCWLIVGGCGIAAGGAASGAMTLFKNGEASKLRDEARRFDDMADRQMPH